MKERRIRKDRRKFKYTEYYPDRRKKQRRKKVLPEVGRK